MLSKCPRKIICQYTGSSYEVLISCTCPCCVVDLLRLQTIYSNHKHFDKTFQNHCKKTLYTYYHGNIYRTNFIYYLLRSLWQFPFHSVTQYPLLVTKFIISQKLINNKYFIIIFKKIIFLKIDA